MEYYRAKIIKISVSVSILIIFVFGFIPVSFAQRTITKLECPSGSFPVFEEKEIKKEISAGDLFLWSLPGGSYFALKDQKKVKAIPKACAKPALLGRDQCQVDKGEQPFQQSDKKWICYVPPLKVEYGDKPIEIGKIRPYDAFVQIPCYSKDSKNPEIAKLCKEPATTPANYLARLYQFALMIAGLAGLGAIVLGAIQYILSAGNVISQQDAKETITQALMGILLLLGAVLILNTIDPSLVNLKDPGVKKGEISPKKLVDQYKQTEGIRESQIVKCPTGYVVDGSGKCIRKCEVGQKFDPDKNDCVNICTPPTTRFIPPESGTSGTCACPVPGQIEVNGVCITPQ